MANPLHPICPWQQSDWRRLLEQHVRGKLPHALLLTGPMGIGKARFGEQLANYLLCQQPTADQACGECRSCLLIAAGTHPDKLQVSPEEKGKAIKVDQVRAINDFLGKTAQQGGYKVVLLWPADALNINAANALLKNLEEPSGVSIFILVSDQPSRMPATVRSRCNQLAMAIPQEVEARTWLQQQIPDAEELDLLLSLSNGAPLLALERSGGDFLQQRSLFFKGLAALQQRKAGAIEIAQQWQKMDLLAVLNWLSLCLTDLIKFNLTQDESVIKNQDLTGFLLGIAKQVRPDELYLYMDRVNELKQALLSGNNPNKILLLEDLLINWSNWFSQK